MAYDNLSFVPSWLSDALCRLSTGGGFATRELYTDQDEIIFDAMRPVMLTSIEEVATRSDLLDRCLIVWLPSIPEDQPSVGRGDHGGVRACSASGYWAPCSTHCQVRFANCPNTKLDKLPRMADFARWVTAAESSLGWETGEFLAAYQGNRDSANDLAIESSPVGQPLLDCLEANGHWDGTATALLDEIEKHVSEQTKAA